MTALATSAMAFWLLWGRLLDAANLNGSVKDFYLPDQFVYMAVARNIQVGLPAFFVEPYTTTGSSIAPSGYFWLLGLVAKIPGLTVFGAWNLVGMLTSLGLIAVMVWWAWWVLPHRLGWAIAPIALMVGTYQWAGQGGWVSQYDVHAVLWPPLAILYNPGAEPAAIVATMAALILFGVALARRGCARVAWATGAGGALGLVILSHTYVAMFAALALTIAVAARAALDEGRRALLTTGGVIVAAVLLAALLPLSTPLGRLLIIVGAPVVLLATRRSWRRPYLVPLLAAGGGALAISSPLVIEIARQAMQPDSFFFLRQQWATDIPLGLPPLSVLGQFLPVWVLGACAAVALGRGERTPRRAWWFAVVTSLLLTTLILTFNEWWGFSQEPYRFLPYGILLIAGASLPWLWEALTSPGRWRLAAGAVVLLYVVTIPSLGRFAGDATTVFSIPDPERTAYERIAALTHHQLTMYDACFRGELVKVAGGGRVLAFNRGHAIPDHYAEVQAVVDEVNAKQIPTDADLRALGVQWIVTSTNCHGLHRTDLRKRFGTPLILPLAHAAALLQPPNTAYELFRVPRGSTGGAS